MRLRWTVATTKDDPTEARPFTWGAQTRPTRGAQRTTARRRRGEPDGGIYDGTRRFW
jgi:hypothetical protein